MVKPSAESSYRSATTIHGKGPSGSIIDSAGNVLAIGECWAVHWYVYMILCSDNSLYTGITTNVERRFSQHTARRGAKFFRGRKPQRVVYLECRHTRSSAGRREVVIKNMRRPDKHRLIESSMNEVPAPVETA